MLAAIGSSACTSHDSGWPELPDSTRALLLVTGADGGFWAPQGCNHGTGGAQYRPALDRWLAQHAPTLERIWLSAGNTINTPESGLLEPPQMLERLHQLPYRAIAVGERELALIGPAELRTLARQQRIPLVASHLYARDAMQPLLPASIELSVAGGTWVVFAIGPDQRDWSAPVDGLGAIVTVDAINALAGAVADAKRRGARVALLSNVPAGTLHQALASVPGIDLALATDGSTRTIGPVPLEPTPVVWLGHAGLGLARIALGAQGELLSVDCLSVEPPFPVDPTRAAPDAP